MYVAGKISVVQCVVFLLTDMESEVIPEDNEEYDDVGKSDISSPQVSMQQIEDDIYEVLPGTFEILHKCVQCIYTVGKVGDKCPARLFKKINIILSTWR